MKKPRFNRKAAAWVCIRPFRLTSEIFCKPGDDVPEGLRLFHLRSLHDRVRIAEKGSDYANFMLSQIQAQDDDLEVDVEQQVDQSIIDAAEQDPARTAFGFSTEDWLALPEEERELARSTHQASLEADERAKLSGDDNTVKQQTYEYRTLKGGWYEIIDAEGNTLKKVQGQKALDEALEQLKQSNGD